MTCLNLSISPLKNKNQNISQKSISKLVEKDLKSSSNGPIPSHLTKVPLSFRTWSDRKISWDLLPHSIHDIGKLWVIGILHFWLLCMHWKKHQLQSVSSDA
ncbi:hypothetical protein CsSME_00011920 [Camellia sinensis var. sinensis]